MKNLRKFATPTNILLAGIIIAACVLRMQGILNGTFAFTYDVGRDLLAARDIIENGNIILIGPTTGLHGLFYGPWWYYFLTLPYVIFDGDPKGAVGIIALTGAVTVFLGFLLGKRLSDTRLGLIFAATIAFSHEMIGLTSQLWNPNIAPLLLIGIFLLLEYFTNTKKRSAKKDTFMSILLGICVGLSFDAEVVYGTLLAVSLLFVYLLFFRKLLHPKLLAATIFGSLLAFLPRIIFELKNNFLMSKNVITYLTSGESSGSIAYTRGILDQIESRAEAFFTLWQKTVAGESYEIGIILLFLLVAALLLTYKKLDKKEKLFSKISGVILLTFFLGLLLLKEEVYSHYIVGLPLPILFLTSVAIYSLSKKSTVLMLVATVILSIVMLKPQSFFQDYTAALDRDPAVYRNYLSTIDYVYEKADGREFNYELFTPPIHDHTYKYLFEWYGERMYGYAPSRDTRELFFYIIEPDRQYNFRVEEWLDVRKENGKVVDEVTQKGDVRVQTRNR